jgi:hypothetical protein
MLTHIFKKKKQVHRYITIVSGLPRSGTSMMMKMLEAGGIEAVVDNLREADTDNPNGYYEYENVKKIKEDRSFLDNAYGKSIKIISNLLYDLPDDRKYKIIFMIRDMDEILASQKKMLQRRQVNTSDTQDQEMSAVFTKHITSMQEWLKKQKHMEVIYVHYNSMMREPYKNVQLIKRFLPHRLDIDKMVAVVDQTLYRNRAQHA